MAELSIARDRKSLKLLSDPEKFAAVDREEEKRIPQDGGAAGSMVC